MEWNVFFMNGAECEAQRRLDRCNGEDETYYTPGWYRMSEYSDMPEGPFDTADQAEFWVY